MAYFVITGKNDCPNCAHAVHVAEHLDKQLPHFKYRTIIKSQNDWPTWLDQLNSTNNWHETRSPVIWKEINKLGGKAYLIGGLGEFWEYCYDYYGFESNMSKETLTKIMADNLLIASHRGEVQVRNISIIGASNYNMLQFVLYELQGCFRSSMEIRLYDQQFLDDPDLQDFLLQSLADFTAALKGNPRSLFVVPTMPSAIQNCDLLIVIDDYSRRSGENADSWLHRCRRSMVLLAGDINVYAKRSLRVVLNHFGAVCFTATVLMEYCTIIKLSNIVAITADEGISLIGMMAEKVGELVENFWCPPVWGFSGIDSYVSISATPITTQVYKPFKRSLKTKESSKLPKGKVVDEIRLLGHLISTDDALYAEVAARKAEEMRILGREAFLPKVRALGSLLRLWFAEEITDDIISLGICSNGSFGFPVGVCFSQAVILNENRIWEPVSYLPIRPETKAKVAAISLLVEHLLKTYDLGERFVSDNDL